MPDDDQAAPRHQLPDFPLDDATLDLLWAAINPDWSVAERTSLHEFLQFVSELGGSDTAAVAREWVDEDPVGLGEQVQWQQMRDPIYSVNDLISALITEVRLLRREHCGGCEGHCDRRS